MEPPCRFALDYAAPDGADPAFALHLANCPDCHGQVRVLAATAAET